jgi:hypothetical protein
MSVETPSPASRVPVDRRRFLGTAVAGGAALAVSRDAAWAQPVGGTITVTSYGGAWEQFMRHGPQLRGGNPGAKGRAGHRPPRLGETQGRRRNNAPST